MIRLLALLAFLTASISLFAQSDRGAITGIVIEFPNNAAFKCAGISSGPSWVWRK